ncbi:hypothetical protein AAC387_Pa11g1244 [Persea americana]
MMALSMASASCSPHLLLLLGTRWLMLCQIKEKTIIIYQNQVSCRKSTGKETHIKIPGTDRCVLVFIYGRIGISAETLNSVSKTQVLLVFL